MFLNQNFGIMVFLLKPLDKVFRARIDKVLEVGEGIGLAVVVRYVRDAHFFFKLSEKKIGTK
jgi:hypothetical protein